MGFVPGLTIQIEAFLTEKGAEQLMSSGVGDIKYFSVSDDASNYSTSELLGLNQMISLTGKYLVNNKQLSVVNLTTLESKIFVDNSAETYKTFESDSGSILLEKNIEFKYEINSAGIYDYVLNTSGTTSEYLNWVKDLKLPYGGADNSLWNTTYSNGGYSDTAIADMNTSNFLVFVIDSSQFSYIDGKSMKFTIPYLSGSVVCYSSYINTNMGASFYDSQVNDLSSNITRFGPNTVLLFADDIQRPNADLSKSWATGYNFNNAPYSQGGKYLSNFNAVPGRNKDVAVGVAYLDKGVIVIFNPVLFAGYVNRTNTSISLTNNNLIRRTVSNYICDLPIGKYYRSQNSTFSIGTPVRLTSIGLYNTNKELVAIGRFNSQVEKNMGERLTILVKIVI
jgi:hypothetical protein